jgi:hypothetical protein
MRGEDGRIACVRYVLPDTRRPTGLARGAGGSPHARVPTASSNSRRLTSWTGWPISCLRRGSTGIAITGCSPRITSSGPPSRPMTKRKVGKRRDAATGRHAVNGHAAGGDATGDCCGSCDKPPSHDTSRRQRPTSLLGWARSFLLRARGVVATSGSSRSDCFPSAKPSLAFALLATSGCCGLPVRDPGPIRKILTPRRTARTTARLSRPWPTDRLGRARAGPRRMRRDSDVARRTARDRHPQPLTAFHAGPREERFQGRSAPTRHIRP